MASKLFLTKSFSSIQSEHENSQLKRSLGPWQLTALGIGGVIGTGIFVLTPFTNWSWSELQWSLWIDVVVHESGTKL